MEFIFQFLLVILLVFLNGYFVAAEFALVGVRKTRINELANKGNSAAKIVQKALDNLDSYISATQLGITLASLGLGWIGEPAIARVIEPSLNSYLGADASFITAHTLAVIIGFSFITFLHIVLGELAPKTIALQRAEATSLYLIIPLAIFTTVFKPFIWVLNGAGNLVVRSIGLHPPQGHQLVHSEEEIKMILSQSQESGLIPKGEAEMVQNIFKLGDTTVRQIMIPRTDIIAFNVVTPLSEVVKTIKKHPHSRFPVFENSIDTIIGFVHVKDIYREVLKLEEEGKPSSSYKLSQTDIIRQIITIPEMKKGDSVLIEMKKKRVHIAVVNDEFGGTSGLITLEDVLESVVGEIEDEFEKPLKDIIRQAGGGYTIDGLTPIEKVQEKFKLPLKGQGYTTIGGLIFGLLGHEPRIDDKVQIGDIIFESDQIEGKRIKTLKVKKDTSKRKT